jgi:hypothetical protein
MKSHSARKTCVFNVIVIKLLLCLPGCRKSADLTVCGYNGGWPSRFYRTEEPFPIVDIITERTNRTPFQDFSPSRKRTENNVYFNAGLIAPPPITHDNVNNCERSSTFQPISKHALLTLAFTFCCTTLCNRCARLSEYLQLFPHFPNLGWRFISDIQTQISWRTSWIQNGNHVHRTQTAWGGGSSLSLSETDLGTSILCGYNS